MKIIRLFCLLTFLFSLNSCKLIKSLTELNKTTPKLHELKAWDKEILFLPMHHMGKPEFYDNVKEIIKNKKEDGFRVYYELVTTDFTNDDSLRNEIRRKARKIKGFNGTYKDNANGSYFSKYIQQPSYPDLGIDSTDIWADVDYLQLITYWENVNGEIILDSTDMNTPFNEKLDRSVSYTKLAIPRFFSLTLDVADHYCRQGLFSLSSTYFWLASAKWKPLLIFYNK